MFINLSSWDYFSDNADASKWNKEKLCSNSLYHFRAGGRHWRRWLRLQVSTSAVFCPVNVSCNFIEILVMGSYIT